MDCKRNLSDPSCENGNFRFTTVPLNLYLSFNSDNSYMFSCNRNAEVTFIEKPELKIIWFKITSMNVKFMLDQAFNGTVVNRTCHFIDEESLKEKNTNRPIKWYFSGYMGCSPGWTIYPYGYIWQYNGIMNRSNY